MTYYFIVIAEFGIATYGIREVARRTERPDELRKTVSELVSLHLLTSLISLLLYVVFVAALYHKINDLRLILFSVSFLLVNAFACEWYFWGTEQFKYITIRSLTTRLLGLASIFILIHEPGDYFLYYAIIAGTAMINLAWNSFRMFKEVKIRFTKVNWRKHIPFLKITYQISLVYSIVLMLDNVFLQLLSTSVAVAYYAFAVKVARISGALVTDALLVFYPRTVSLVHKNEHATLQTIVLHSSKLIVVTTIPMATGIFLLADDFTIIYFGEAFAPLADNLKILSLYPLVKAYSLFLNKQLLMPYDKEKIVLKGLWLGAIVFVCFTVPLSFYFADKGTSVAVMLSEVAVLFYNVYYVKKLKYQLKIFSRTVALEALGGSILFLPLVYSTEYFIANRSIAIVAEVMLCILFYFIFLFFITKNEMAVSLVKSLKPSALTNKGQT